MLRSSFGSVSDDQRIQAVIIAFCFGALIEALAGFGTPVAICTVMLIALRLQPLKAAVVALVANTAPVAFGAIAVPITTLASMTDCPRKRSARWSAARPRCSRSSSPWSSSRSSTGRGACGRSGRPPSSPASSSPWRSTYVQLLLARAHRHRRVAARGGRGGAAPALLAARAELTGETPTKPRPERRVAEAGGGRSAAATATRTGSGPGSGSDAHSPRRRRDVFLAYVPYLTIIVVFSIAQIPVVKDPLAQGALTFGWPRLNQSSPRAATALDRGVHLRLARRSGHPAAALRPHHDGLPRVSPGGALRAYGATLDQLKWAILTVAAVLGLAYVMNLSGQTVTIGMWIAGSGAFFAFLSPVLGWLGVAVTGSDTSSNALFGTLQVTAAREAGLSEVLLAAANSSGGVLGKMISPQNLAIAAAAIGMPGKEGDLFRKVIGWSLGFLLIMCVLVYLQSTPVLGWMVP